MSDLRTLNDPFAELERRADATAAGRAPVVRPRRVVRLVPVAAAVVAVAGLGAGAVWLVPGDSGPLTTSSSTAPATTMARSPVPATPDDLIARFRVVLGDTATFEVITKDTLPGGPPTSKYNPPPGSGPVVPQTANPDFPTSALIFGTLTSAGITGSFSLTILPGDSESGVWCDSRTKDCDVTTLPDGSRLATGTVRPDRGAVSYQAYLKRPDGTVVRMHVGNQEDPQGAVINSPGGEIYSPQPPLTLDQLKAIVTSGKW
jgi:hypothetical protein